MDRPLKEGWRVAAMAWLYIRLPGGTLKVKPRSHLRSLELNHLVPMLDFGFVIFSWWSREQVKADRQR